jgi:hypothetical protein
MREKREKISFWITVVSFIGSILFVGNIMVNGNQRDKQYKECFEKALYYQHKSDSLERIFRKTPH